MNTGKIQQTEREIRRGQLQNYIKLVKKIAETTWTLELGTDSQLEITARADRNVEHGEYPEEDRRVGPGYFTGISTVNMLT